MNALRVLLSLAIAITAQVLLGHLWSRSHLYLNLVTVVVVVVAVQASPSAGMIAGSIGGLFQDTFSSQLIGVSSFGKTLVGFALGVLNVKLVIRGPLFLLPLIFVASCLEMGIAVLLDKIVQVRPAVTGGSILTVALGNAILGTLSIKIAERFSHRKR